GYTSDRRADAVPITAVLGAWPRLAPSSADAERRWNTCLYLGDLSQQVPFRWRLWLWRFRSAAWRRERALSSPAPAFSSMPAPDSWRRRSWGDLYGKRRLVGESNVASTTRAATLGEERGRWPGSKSDAGPPSRGCVRSGGNERAEALEAVADALLL